jgi:hypothetical protein
MNNPLIYIDPTGHFSFGAAPEFDLLYGTWDAALLPLNNLWSDRGFSGSYLSSNYGAVSLNTNVPNFNTNSFSNVGLSSNINLNFSNTNFSSTYNRGTLEVGSFGPQYVANNPVNSAGTVRSESRAWWNPLNYVGLGSSQNFLDKGSTRNTAGIEQQTHTYGSFVGKTLDIYIGGLPSLKYPTYEIGVSFLLVGVGYFYGNPDAFSNYQYGGLAIHLGLSVDPLIGYFTVTDPLPGLWIYTGPTDLLAR